ncbi:unnamed protein product [Cochlearia groenlandica]
MDSRSKSDMISDRLVTGGDSDIDNFICVIEYLAKFKSEIWMVHDVFEMCPKLPEDLGEETTEMVAFRCLSSLFDCSVHSEDVSSVDDKPKKIEFDSSLSCEYVLQCILDEIPLLELKPGAPDLSKWNLLPFIEAKLLSLPKCALEMMVESSRNKDTIVSSRRHDGDSSFRHPKDGIIATNNSDSSAEGEIDGYENRYKCVQCDESGKLLFCSGDGCTVMVHAKCASPSPPFFDHAGNFYCFHCGLNCESADYGQSKDEVVKAKKKLFSFLSLVCEVNKKKSI